MGVNKLKLVAIIALISIAVVTGNQNSVFLESENIVLSDVVYTFFRNFYHCLFQFHVGSTSSHEQNLDWDLYTTPIKFYGGESPFTIQNGNTSIPKHRKRQNVQSARRRYSNCTVQLQIYCNQVTKGTAVGQREFLWFIFTDETEHCHGGLIQDGFKRGLIEDGYPGVFFGIFNFNSVHMLCFSCLEQKRFTNLKELATNDIPSYKKLWSSLHSKLSGATFVINYLEAKLPNFKKLDNWTSCNIHKGHSFPVETCTYFSIMKELNFSTVYTKQLYSLVSNPIYDGSILSRNVMNWQLANWLSSNHLEMVSYAMNIRPYAYILIIDSIGSNFSTAITQPFDWQTWLALIIAIFVVAFMLRLAYVIVYSASSTSIYTCIPTFGLLLDQPATNLKSKATSGFITWCVWSFVAITLSQFYKGTLFSFLSISVAPRVPDNLEEVLETNKFIVTSGSAYAANMKDDATGVGLKASSILRDLLLEDMLESHPELNASIYGKLHRKLEWLGSDFGKIFLGILRTNSFFSIYSNRSAEVEVPTKYFFMDMSHFVERFRMYLKFFTRKWVSKSHPLPCFVGRAGWAVSHNYMYDRIKIMLARVYESGLYERWETYWHKNQALQSMRNIVNKLDKNVKKDLLRKGKKLSYINSFQFVYMSEEKQHLDSEAKPIEFSMLAIILVYTMVSFLFASVVFIHECLN
ncbi:unnamed protein product [Orchesella dallaii]|uniref:Uncharacterized protein n=1 Tax=Orchesella dallaii TaxID=48710 RepID=A0ABP1RAQ1_9HEXA